MSKSTWTDERVSELKRLNATTKLSMTQIAMEMNLKFGTRLTSSAVIGKLDRLNAKAERPVKNGVDYRPKKRVEVGKPCLAAKLIVSKAAALATAPREGYDPGVASEYSVPIGQLNSCTCRWPLGNFQDRPPFMYCGRPVEKDSRPWCPAHKRISLTNWRTA